MQAKVRDIVRDPSFDLNHLQEIVQTATDEGRFPAEALVYAMAVMEARNEKKLTDMIQGRMQEHTQEIQSQFQNDQVISKTWELLYNTFPNLRGRVEGRTRQMRFVADIANEIVDDINDRHGTDYKDAEDYVLTAYTARKYNLVDVFVGRLGRKAEEELGISTAASPNGRPAPGSKPAARSAGRVAERAPARMPGQSGAVEDDGESEKRRTLLDNIGVRSIR